MPGVVRPTQTKNVLCRKDRTQSYLRWIGTWIRLGLEDGHGDSCSRRRACGAGPREAYNKEGWCEEDNVLGNGGLRGDQQRSRGNSDDCGTDRNLPHRARSRPHRRLSAGVGQRYQPQHHAVMSAAAPAAGGQAGICLCTGNQRLQRQQSR